MRSLGAQHTRGVTFHHTPRAVERLVDGLDRDPVAVGHVEFVDDLFRAPL